MKYLILTIAIICFNLNPLQALPSATINSSHEEKISKTNPNDKILSLKNLKERLKLEDKKKSSKKVKPFKIVVLILLGGAVILALGFAAIGFLWRA